jgi:WD40 repeat protein
MKGQYAHRVLLSISSLILLWMFFVPHTIVAQNVQPTSANTLSWNPAGTELAIFADNGVFIYDRDFRLLRYRELEKGVYGGWSPDGTKLKVGNQIWDADTLELLSEFEVTLYGWLYGGSQIYSSSGNEITIFDATNGNLIKRVPLDFQIEGALTNPDGTQLISVFGNRVSVIDADNGIRTMLYVLPVRIVSSYELSPDGASIVYSASSSVPVGTPGSTPLELQPDTANLVALSIMDIKTGNTLFVSDPLPNPIINLSWSGDGSRIAGVSQIGAVYIWDAHTLELLIAFSVGQATGQMAYSPYGGVLAIGANPNAGISQPPQTQPSTLAPATSILLVANGVVQVIVPEPSFERLGAIQSACVQRNGGATSVAIPRIEADLNNYVAQLKTAPADQLPPGCAADLIAIAKAIQSQ